VAHRGEEAVERSADCGNGDERTRSNGVGSFVPVQRDVGFVLVLSVQPKFAPAVLGSAGCDAVLHILESLVEGVLDTPELLSLFLLERRDRFRQVLKESQFVDDGSSRRHSLEEVGNHGEKLGAVCWVTPGNTCNRSRAYIRVSIFLPSKEIDKDSQ
jgi:hypothetical protein